MSAFNLKVGYEDPGLGDVVEDDPHKNIKIAMARWAAGILEYHYPGQPWAVQVKVAPKGDGGIIMVSLPALMGQDHHYTCSLEDCWNDVGGQKTIVAAGGEILERFKIPRGNFSAADWQNAMALSPNHLFLNLDPLQG